MITKDEFLEKYGEVLVEFDWYYKYTFYYLGQIDATKTITIGVGGDSGDIYRDEHTANFPVSIVSLQPYQGEVKEGKKTIESFYDY